MQHAYYYHHPHHATDVLVFACDPDYEFECDNSECIDLGKRCDRRYDCTDKSDENGCYCK